MQNVASFPGSPAKGEPGNKAMKIVNQRLFHSISLHGALRNLADRMWVISKGVSNFLEEFLGKMVWGGGGGGGSLFYETERNSSVTLFYKIKQVWICMLLHKQLPSNVMELFHSRVGRIVLIFFYPICSKLYHAIMPKIMSQICLYSMLKPRAHYFWKEQTCMLFYTVQRK